MPAIDETEPREDGRAPIEDSGSLSDHEAEYSGKRQDRPAPLASVAETEVVGVPSETAPTDTRDEQTGRFTPRKHRAKSQEASPSDIATIQALSRELKDAEEAAGITVERKEGESQRVYDLRRRVEIAKAVKARAATTASPEPAPRVPAVAAPSQPVPEKFDYPSYDAALGKDPNLSYEQWQRDEREAYLDWRDSKREATRQAQAHEQYRTQVQESHRQRFDAFAQSSPDFRQKLTAAANAGYDIPNVVREAIERHDNGPAFMYALLNQPDEMDRLWLSNGATPVTEQAIVAMQRYLTAFTTRAQTGTTGAVASPVTPRRIASPPTPVRTGSMQTGTPIPDDGASLAEHEQHYYKRRSR